LELFSIEKLEPTHFIGSLAWTDKKCGKTALLQFYCYLKALPQKGLEKTRQRPFILRSVRQKNGFHGLASFWESGLSLPCPRQNPSLKNHVATSSNDTNFNLLDGCVASNFSEHEAFLLVGRPAFLELTDELFLPSAFAKHWNRRVGGRSLGPTPVHLPVVLSIGPSFGISFR